jgi:hypothetical protein
VQIQAIIALLALPLLVPLALLVLVHGLRGMRDGRFELYSARFEGVAGRLAGALASGLAVLLLGYCAILAAQVLGLMGPPAGPRP